MNEAPVFGEGDSTDRNVDENTEAGMAFGDPVAAMDVDAGDTLEYSLDEMGDMSFDIDPATGQLMTEAALDYESGTTSYSVTVTATDSGGLYAMIVVTIAVNDVPETPIFEREAAVFLVEENVPVGTVVGTETAIHAESYSDDSDYFDVDDMGNIKTTMMLDYESGTTSYMVSVTATGVDGATDTIDVTVTVGDAHPDCTVMDNMGLTNDCEALLDAKGDLGRRPELGYRHRHGRLGRRVDERRACIGGLAERRRPGRLGFRCVRSPGHADFAEPAHQLAERLDTGPERRDHARRAVPAEQRPDGWNT